MKGKAADWEKISASPTKDVYLEYIKNSPNSITVKQKLNLKQGKLLDQILHQRKYKVEKQAHKKYSMLLIIRKMHVKIMMRSTIDLLRWVKQ